MSSMIGALSKYEISSSDCNILLGACIQGGPEHVGVVEML